MPEKMNWDSAETWQRIVASIVASGVKLDIAKMARYYGTTYDTLENRFRQSGQIKKLAAVMKEEVDGGERGEIKSNRSAPVTPRKIKTPKKDALSNVANGRVAKSSPSKRAVKKQELIETRASSFMEGMGKESFQHDEDFAFTGGDFLGDEEA
ncbi:hypothetical protein LTR53_000961 [Teratosphaeriaceae sp. CCFEE 6253]|nr:hypothetical protein LTR53_000961 [Teratosphaeriaceae sp. CCFEE 6253]